MQGQDVEADVRNHKVKEGTLLKRSRAVKDWKKSWIVLTKTYLYSFQTQGVYRTPTEKIPLKDISTIKSFYKQQYGREQVFRVDSDDAYFYLSAHDHQQKWSWATSIERIIELLRNPHLQDSQNLVRQSLRMSSAVRQSGVHQSNFNRKSNHPSSELNLDIFKKLKLKLFSQQLNILVPPNSKSSRISKMYPISLQGQPERGDSMKKSEKVVERFVERLVEVPVEKIVERIIEVEKIVEVERGGGGLIELFWSLIGSKLQDPRPILDFIGFLMLTGAEQFQRAALDFCCQEQAQRFFAELLLQALNEETSEERINNYSAFIYVILERIPDYFYVSDLRILVEIVLRELQLYRSDLNQMINLRVLRVMVTYHLSILGHKRDELRAITEEIANLGAIQNRQIAKEVLLLTE